VGHAFSPETMLSAQSEVLEEALWTAVKTLEETLRAPARPRLAGQALRGEGARGPARVETIRWFLLKNDSSEVPIEIAAPGR
jgi:hypothetical protein